MRKKKKNIAAVSCRALVVKAALVLAIVVPCAGVAQAAGVFIKLSWVNKNLPGKMQVYELKKSTHARLWDTGEKDKFEDLKAGAEITGEAIEVERGGTKRFMLVYHNDSSSDVYFFAAPHAVEPVENALGFKFKCLCVNHAFSAGAGRYWYRVVEARVSKDFVGDNLTITHTLIGTDRERLGNSASSHMMPDM